MTIDDLDALARGNYECAKKCLISIQESRDIGAQSAVTLNEQGEQINRIGGHADTVHETLDESEKKLNVISSIFGNIQTWFQSIGKRKTKETPVVHQIEMGNGQFITRRHREQQQQVIHHQDIEEETDELISQIASAVDDLKNLSVHMGKELDRQNEVLTKVGSEVDHAIPRLQKATKVVQQAID